jgi:hypothetical protein
MRGFAVFVDLWQLRTVRRQRFSCHVLMSVDHVALARVTAAHASPSGDTMAVDYVDHFQQKVADVRADGRHQSELQKVPDSALDGRFAFAVGADGRAVSG